MVFHACVQTLAQLKSACRLGFTKILKICESGQISQFLLLLEKTAMLKIIHNLPVESLKYKQQNFWLSFDFSFQLFYDVYSLILPTNSLIMV